MRANRWKVYDGRYREKKKKKYGKNREVRRRIGMSGGDRVRQQRSVDVIAIFFDFFFFFSFSRKKSMHKPRKWPAGPRSWISNKEGGVFD